MYWTKIAAGRPYNVFLFAYLGWQQNNLVNNQRLQTFDNYFAFLSGNLNWKASKKLSLKADGRATISRQAYQKSTTLIRGDVKAKAEYNLSEKTYVEIQNTTYLNSSIVANRVSYHILNLTFYQYLLPSNRLGYRQRLTMS